MSVNFSMETIDYCKMNPAATARPGYQDSHLGEALSDDNYAKPMSTRKEETRLQNYTSLRKSKIEERNYMQIKVATDDSDRAHLKKMSDFMRALCCVVVYVTVTFVITSTLLAYTIWTVSDLRNDYKGICTDLGRKVDEIHGNVSALRSNVTYLHDNYTRNMSILESEVNSLHSKVDGTCVYTKCIGTCTSQCTVSITYCLFLCPSSSMGPKPVNAHHKITFIYIIIVTCHLGNDTKIEQNKLVYPPK